MNKSMTPLWGGKKKGPRSATNASPKGSKQKIQKHHTGRLTTKQASVARVALGCGRVA